MNVLGAARINEGMSMPMMRAETSTLLLIDFQAKLMPAIDQAAATVTNARRLVDAAGLVGAPILFTEQNPKGLGPTVAELAPDPSAVLRKMTFGAVGARRLESKEIALQRMARSGAEIVTMEMVVFEWLQTAGHPRFKEAIALMK